MPHIYSVALDKQLCPRFPQQPKDCTGGGGASVGRFHPGELAALVSQNKIQNSS